MTFPNTGPCRRLSPEAGMGAAIGARDTQGQSIRPPAIKSRAVRGLSIAGGLNLRPAGYEPVSADDLSHLIRQCGSKPGVLGLVEMYSVDVARGDQRSRVEEPRTSARRQSQRSGGSADGTSPLRLRTRHRNWSTSAIGGGQTRSVCGAPPSGPQPLHRSRRHGVARRGRSAPWNENLRTSGVELQTPFQRRGK